MQADQEREALEPCPFCGGPTDLADHEKGPLIRGAFAGCKPCGISTPITSTCAEAIAAWNRRTPQPAASQAGVPAGWKVFPPQPTPEMEDAFFSDATGDCGESFGDFTGNDDGAFGRMYATMFAAAPVVTQPAGEEADAIGRTPTAYALEFAEYMALSAETLLHAVNAEAALRLRIAESDDVSADAEYDAKCDVDEAMRGVRNGVHEFRKRRDRAAAARSTQAPA